MSGGANTFRPGMALLLLEAKQSLRAHRLVIGLVIGHVVITFGVMMWFGLADKISLTIYQPAFVVLCFVIVISLLAGRATYLMLVIRPNSLIRTIVDDLTSRWITQRRFLNALPMLLALTVFMSTFTSMKSMIPVIHPYDWDATLAVLDQKLHFGVAPWLLLQPLVGYPIVTAVLNAFYNLWLFVLLGFWFWQAVSLRNPRLRMQFFVSSILCFALLGNLLATLFASAGPCFYERIVAGPDPFAPLMNYLRSASMSVPGIYAIDTQNMLWRFYQNRAFGAGAGISAMPSLHLSAATLFALLGWRVHRVLGVVLTVFAGILLIGSIHLGWHYALDGYFAIAATFAIWWAVAAMMRLAPDSCGIPRS
jgi:hypothetical protein